jgi:hypothetical protein
MAATSDATRVLRMASMLGKATASNQATTSAATTPSVIQMNRHSPGVLIERIATAPRIPTMLARAFALSPSASPSATPQTTAHRRMDGPSARIAAIAATASARLIAGSSSASRP